MAGGYYYHTFNAAGTFDPAARAPLTVDYLVVGAGGGGGDFLNGVRWPSGGASGVCRVGSTVISTPQTVTLGVGGIGDTGSAGVNGGNGTASSLGAIASATGGQGGGVPADKFGGNNADFVGSTTGGNGGGAGAGGGGNGSDINGGAGYVWAPTGTTYALGGAGRSSGSGTHGSPGALSGPANTGQGGGGGGYDGGSGVVIVRYPV